MRVGNGVIRSRGGGRAGGLRRRRYRWRRKRRSVSGQWSAVAQSRPSRRTPRQIGGRERLNRCAALVLIFAAVASFLLISRQALAQVPQASEESVLRKLALGRVAADYVVLVDTSGSMQANGLYRRLKPSLLNFLAALSAHDHLSLITFDTTPQLRYSGRIGPRRLKGLRTFARARNHTVKGRSFVTAAPIVRRLPRKATGAKTDIGSAIDRALAEVERPSASRIASVIMFTDGKHDPPPGSPYPPISSRHRTSSSRAWTRLRARGARLERSRLMSAYSIALKQRTDAAALRRILHDTIVVALPRKQLRFYLNRVKYQTRIQKARAILDRDLTSTIRVRWPPSLRDVSPADGSLEATVVLRSTATRIPYAILDPLILSSDPDLKVSDVRERVWVRPHQTTRMPLKLSWRPSDTFGFGKRLEQIVDEGSLELTYAKLDSPWARALREFGLRLRPEVATARTTIHIAGEVGWSWTRILIVALLLMALFAAAILRWFQTHARLTGWLRIQEPRPLWHAGEKASPLATGDHDSLLLQLAGRATSFGPRDGLWAGRGRVRASKPLPFSPRKNELELVITYSNDRSRRRMKTRRCRQGDDVLINGAVFGFEMERGIGDDRISETIPTTAASPTS